MTGTRRDRAVKAWVKKMRARVTMVEIPCNNCGRPVSVPDGFQGCAFCPDCSRSDTGFEANSEAFHHRWRHKGKEIRA